MKTDIQLELSVVFLVKTIDILWPTAFVLLDLSAAFGTIDHSTLLSRLLTWFAVGDSVLKWFSSYLTEWYKSIKIGFTVSNLCKLLKIGSTLSDLCKLLFGVPQGCLSGPLLFLLYTKPLSLVSCKHKRYKV